jgi:hypothetical protein
LEVSVLYFRQKAAQCRRLANGVLNQNDPVVKAFLAMAAEFDAKALEAERGGYDR